jgi:hypothetical protein
VKRYPKGELHALVALAPPSSIAPEVNEKLDLLSTLFAGLCRRKRLRTKAPIPNEPMSPRLRAPDCDT